MIAEEKSLLRAMKTLVVAVISLAFSFLLPLALGQVDRYEMSIVERGTPFSEQIEVDEKQDVEVFRVPAHNDVDAADFYHDFKMRVTVTRVPSRKVCYVAKMDPSMSSPGKLKADLQLDLARAAFQPRQLPVETQMSLSMVTGPANRLLLTKEILDFCGALPIYNTKVYNNPRNENGTLTVRVPRRQRRRATWTIDEFTSCIATETKGKGDELKYIKEGGCVNHKHWDLRCSLRNLNRSCYYYVTCTNTRKVYPAKIQDWKCTWEHRGAENPHCCDYKCPPGTGK